MNVQFAANQTVSDALAICGVLIDTNNHIVNGNNAAERIAAEVFNDNFNTCVDIQFSELEDNWRTYSGLTVAEGRIRIRPRTKVNIKALVQWVRDRVRQDEDPTTIPFPVAERDDLMERYNSHKHSGWMKPLAWLRMQCRKISRKKWSGLTGSRPSLIS